MNLDKNRNIMEQQVNYSFPQGNEVLERLHELEFKMALIIKDIFEANGIRYVIEYGSLLGAVRHGGFIPWDDDFDYVVFQDDYEKASEALRRELPPGYVLHDKVSDPNYFYSFSKVRHLNSKVVDEVPTDNLKYQGVFIDLFRGNVEMNNKYARRLFLAKNHSKSHWRKFVSNKSVSELGKSLGHGVKWMALGFIHAITPKTEYFHRSPENDQYFLPADKYLPFSTVTFNGVEFPAPHDPNYVMTDMYGDWRKYPKKITFHLKHVDIFED